MDGNERILNAAAKTLGHSRSSTAAAAAWELQRSKKICAFSSALSNASRSTSKAWGFQNWFPPLRQRWQNRLAKIHLAWHPKLHICIHTEPHISQTFSVGFQGHAVTLHGFFGKPKSFVSVRDVQVWWVWACVPQAHSATQLWWSLVRTPCQGSNEGSQKTSVLLFVQVVFWHRHPSFLNSDRLDLLHIVQGQGHLGVVQTLLNLRAPKILLPRPKSISRTKLDMLCQPLNSTLEGTTNLLPLSLDVFKSMNALSSLTASLFLK